MNDKRKKKEYDYNVLLFLFCFLGIVVKKNPIIHKDDETDY